MNEPIIIEKIDKSDESRNPRFRYHTELDGQTNYLKHKCDENKVAAVSMNRAVAIYSKRKLVEFTQLIKESFTYVDKEQPTMSGDHLLAVEGMTKLGLFIKKEDGVHFYTTERHFSRSKVHIFTKRLPRYDICHILNSHKEFIDYVQEVEHFII